MRYPGLTQCRGWLPVKIGGHLYVKLDPDAISGVRQVPPENPYELVIYSRDAEPIVTDDPAMFELFGMEVPCASSATD